LVLPEQLNAVRLLLRSATALLTAFAVGNAQRVRPYLFSRRGVHHSLRGAGTTQGGEAMRLAALL